MPWPDVDGDRAEVVVRGQDLRTADDGSALVTDRLDVRLVTELGSGRVLRVAGEGGAVAVGASLRAGFGRHLARQLDGEPRTLRYSALDDLPGAYLVAGYALLRAGLLEGPPGSGVERAAYQADVCIGWATGSTVHRVLVEHDHTAVPHGPVAPALEAGDPTGWHELPVLAPGAVRRRRQVDVWDGVDGGVAVQSHFRDSYAADDHEMVLHEYLVHATVDPAGRISSVTAEARVLPWAECPGAVASAGAVVGVGLDELDGRVRAALVGTTTCTHLNSTLRALADVGALR